MASFAYLLRPGRFFYHKSVKYTQAVSYTASNLQDQLKEPLKNPSLRYPKGMNTLKGTRERSAEAPFKCLIFNMKIASLRSQ